MTARLAALALVSLCSCPSPGRPDAAAAPDAGAVIDAGSSPPRGANCVEVGHHEWRCFTPGSSTDVVRAFAERDSRCAPRETGGVFCVPDGGAMKAGAPLRLELVQSCGAKCDPGPLRCVVAIDGGVIDLSLSADGCNGRSGCPADCVRRRFTCAIPPLDAGDWLVRSSAGDGGHAAPLRLTADGPERCQLP